ncbi:polyphosphate kinase 1 [Propionibacterium sp. oral taxon 192 str. F0372]|uniref:RNA degradosome polyphosphate kinase n=1 Tax=Propionibacterium sp. oral taxon 192 TaxID=671222 RepID=UPI000352CB6B|nr:RNA degradosome polyphosphate kinase [Propionibacterium sp. oral taxon 192]EPH03326.1 polyphosphate kinase 1 [Propionibacterium sp. oral taxon 192 str. F0372]
MPDTFEHIENLPLPEDRYSDRELSWLSFNNRVLDQAKDATRVPLLERAKFLAIFSSNLDEFFMVRVAGLKRRIDAGVAVSSNGGMLPGDLYEAILERTHELVAEQARVFVEEVRPALTTHGVHLLGWNELTEEEQTQMHELFTERIFPILTPLAVDPSHPFPYISGLSLNLGVLLTNPATGNQQFARVKVPSILSRFVKVTRNRYLPLEEIIVQHMDEVFSGMEVMSHVTFRVTRNEDVEVEEDDAENILFAIEKELLSRKVGRPPVRLEVEDSIDDELLSMLTRELDISEDEVFRLPAPLDLTGLFALDGAGSEELRYKNFLPKTHPDLAQGLDTSRPADIFTALRKKDVLVHHPYDSFATSVQRLIEQAASDPKVLAIKQTLYRTSGDSPIVDALIDAARAGKQVLALVELKARFDEQANIRWARKLERNGVHVVYGMVGLKTHCKLMLVVRDEPDGLRRYAHIGTGNYNPKTARQYEDMGLLTCNPIITDDVARLFNHLSGMTQDVNYRRLMVAPDGIRSGLLAHIENEIINHREGKPARIRMKVNSIVDEAIIDALYRASMAGVPVDLWVRGICGLRPGVPGMSENLRVRSILGRFLEHSRIYWFENSGQPMVGIGSADMMHRNLDRRVEAIVSISNRAHIAQIGEILDLAFDDSTVSWHLDDRTWTPVTTDAEGNPLNDIQSFLINRVSSGRH